MSNSQTFLLPTVFPSNNTEIDLLSGPAPNNHNEIRGRSLFTNKSIFRNLSISSTRSSVVYHERMANNSMDVNPVELTPALSHKTKQEKAIHISKVAAKNCGDTLPMQGKLTNINHLQCGPEKDPDFIPTWRLTAQNEESIFINISLSYNPNISTNPEIWGGNFHPIFLHSLIEYLGSDVKSIKDSLRFITKYITNKQIESSKTNNLENFKGIGKTV